MENWLDYIVIAAAHMGALGVFVQKIKLFFELPWVVFILKAVKLGFLVPFIPIIINVCAGILSGIALYGGDGLSVRDVGLIILAIVGADAGHKAGWRPLVAKPNGA